MITKSFQITQPSTVWIINGECRLTLNNSTPYAISMDSGEDLAGRIVLSPYPFSLTNQITFDDRMLFVSGGTLPANTHPANPNVETCTQEVSTSLLTELSGVHLQMTWPNVTGFTPQNPLNWSASYELYLDNVMVREDSSSGTVPFGDAPNFTLPGYLLTSGFPVPKDIRYEIVFTYEYRGS